MQIDKNIPKQNSDFIAVKTRLELRSKFYKVMQLHNACSVGWLRTILPIFLCVCLPKTMKIGWHVSK